MNPPNTTPLNEEDRLGEIKAVVRDGLANHTGEFANPWIFKGSYSHELLADILNDIMASERLFKNLTNLIQTLEKKAYENGLHDGEQVATFVFIKRLQARKKNTAPNSGAGREIKDLLKELEK